MVIVNLYFLSLYEPVPKENKFTDYLAFRYTLYKALFQYLTDAAAAGATESLSVTGPVNLVLPSGDTVPVVNNLNIKDRAELVATVTVAHIAGKILVIATANPYVEHQRVSMKRALCIMCKQATKEEKRGIRGPKSYVF